MLNIAVIKSQFFSNPKMLTSNNIIGQKIQIFMSKLMLWVIGHQGHLVKFPKSINSVQNSCSEAITRGMGEGS